MKGNSRSLIPVALIFALIVLGGGAYAYSQWVHTNPEDITDDQIVQALSVHLNAALDSNRHPNVSHTIPKYEHHRDSQGNGYYAATFTTTYPDSTHLTIYTIEEVYRGDLNNDRYTDAFIRLSICSESRSNVESCAYGVRIVLNNKNGTAQALQPNTPGVISGWSGGSETRFEKVAIRDGIISITSSTFKSSDYYKTAHNLPKQTKKFMLQGNELIELK